MATSHRCLTDTSKEKVDMQFDGHKEVTRAADVPEQNDPPLPLPPTLHSTSRHGFLLIMSIGIKRTMNQLLMQGEEICFGSVLQSTDTLYPCPAISGDNKK